MVHKDITAVHPGDGKKLAIAGGSYRIVVSGEQTGGEFAVIEMTVPAGAGPPPHAHDQITETFCVLEGEVTFYSDNGVYQATEGAFIHIPKGGMIHSFKNKTGEVARLLCTVMPAGLDACFVETVDYIANHAELSDSDRKVQVVRIAEKYGSVIYPMDYFKD